MNNNRQTKTEYSGVDITPYKTVFEHSPSAFALIHVLKVDDQYDDFVFEYANKGYEAMSGFTVEQLNGHAYSEVCGTKSEQWNTLYGDVAYKGIPVSTIQFGSEINRYVSIQAYQIKEGYCALIVLDVNEQVIAEKSSTQEFKRKYELEHQHTLLDKNLIASAIFNISKHKTLEIDRNPCLKPISRSTFIEDFCADISNDIVKPDKRSEFTEIFDIAGIKEKYESGIDEQTIDFQRRLPSGKVIWVRSRFYLIVEPSTSDLLLHYSCMNINERKSMENLVQYISNEDYDMLGCINFHDDSAIFVYGKTSSREELSHQTAYEENYSDALEWFVNTAVVSEERTQYHANSFIKKIQHELSQHDTYEFTLHVLDKDGTRLTKKIRYAGYDKDTETCFFTQSDITQIIAEQEQRQENLSKALSMAEAASNAKTDFLSRMSHDMRTPMNGILGMVALSETEDDNAVLKQNIESIRSSSEYLLGLINDTLDLDKIQRGKLELKPEIVDANQLFNSIIEMTKENAAARGVNFVTRAEGIHRSGYIKADPLRLRQIFINLLSNAVKFTPTGGTVEFCFKAFEDEQDGNIYKETLVVSDTGCGMSDEFLQHGIFNAFSQDANDDSRTVQGSGLGLSIVKSLVEMMGGSIEVESELGAGSTFTVHVPLEEVSEDEYKSSAPQVSRSDTLDSKLLEGKHLLLAEDHPLNAQIAIKLLEKVGCKVTWVKNGQECVEIFNQSAPSVYDAILMDIRMPVMDGLEAAKQIRSLSQPAATAIPILAMTANAYEDDIKKSLNAGMNAHISKPIEPATMYKTIAEHLLK